KPTIGDLLLDGYQARFTKGYDLAATPLRTAVRALRADDVEPGAGLRWFELGFAAAGSLWDDQALLDITDRGMRMARSLGAVTVLPHALAARAFADSLTGRLGQAADRWAEARELMVASQVPGIFGVNSYSEGLLLAYRGQIPEARAAALAQIRESTARAQGVPADLGRSIVAIADLRVGQTQAAVDAALPVIQNDLVFTAEITLPELIEAAVRSDQRRVADDAFAVLTARARTAGTPWALGLRARCRALLDEGSTAEAEYAEAISQLEHSRAAVDLARAHLQYGQWLRRAKRRRDARRELRIAENMFQTMGAAGFAEQAGGELRATGERATARPRRPASFASRKTGSSPWAPPDAPSKLAVNCALPANEPGHGRPAPNSISRPRKPASRNSPPRVRPTMRSPSNCSSVPAPSTTTWAR